MRAELVEVWCPKSGSTDPSQYANGVRRIALRVQLSKRRFLFLEEESFKWITWINAQVIQQPVPDWGYYFEGLCLADPKLTVLKTVSINQRNVGYWIAVATQHEEAKEEFGRLCER